MRAPLPFKTIYVFKEIPLPGDYFTAVQKRVPKFIEEDFKQRMEAFEASKQAVAKSTKMPFAKWRTSLEGVTASDSLKAKHPKYHAPEFVLAYMTALKAEYTKYESKFKEARGAGRPPNAPKPLEAHTALQILVHNDLLSLQKR